MPVSMVMQFAAVNSGHYESVMKEMGLSGNKGDWPKGLISHIAGSTPGGGWCVVDTWNSQADCDAFLQGRLMPAFHKVGGINPPAVTPVQVHNRYAA